MSRMLIATALAALLTTACSTVPEASNYDHLLGTWEGAVRTPAGDLPVAFHISEDHLGLSCVLVSPNQSRRPVYCDGVTFSEYAVQIAVPAVDASYKGWIEADELRGHWTQAGLNFHLKLVRAVQPESALASGLELSD